MPSWHRRRSEYEEFIKAQPRVPLAGQFALGLPSGHLRQETVNIGGKGGHRRILRGNGSDEEVDAAMEVDRG